MGGKKRTRKFRQTKKKKNEAIKIGLYNNIVVLYNASTKIK
jgi:hypothetical protein